MAVNLSYFAGAGWQFFNNSGVPLTGGLLYSYLAGTTTPAVTYTSSSGAATNTFPIVLDSAGRSANEIWLTEGTTYKFVLTTSANVQLGSWDNISGINDLSSFSNTTDIAKGDALVGFRQANYTNLLSGTIGRTVHSKFTEMISVWDFMTTAQIADVQSGTGSIDVRAACQNAINAAKALGAALHFPSGSYLINSTVGPDSKNNGLVIPYTDANSTGSRIKLVGDGASTVLKAGNNNMIVVRWSDSHCEMDGFSIDGNSKTTVWALGLVPESMVQTTTNTFQLYNVFRNLYLLNCDEGIAMRTGPDVSGGDSGCWYNDISASFIYYCKRGIWLMDCPVGSSGVNRNYFHQIRIGQGTNTGVQIDDGSTNVFTEVHTEGISTGTSPNANPTAIYIKATGTSGANNDSNKFIACIQEACTVSLNNANALSEFYGCEFSYPYSMVLTARPSILIGSGGYSPQFVSGYAWQNNNQVAGIPNNIIWPSNGIRSSDDYFTNYQKLIGVNVGTIAGNSSATVTIYAAQTTQQTTIQFVVTADEVTSNSTNTAIGTILAKWQTGSIANTGLSTVTYTQSRGIADYVTFATMTVTITTSSNNLQMTIANTSASQLRTVRIGLIATTS
jgi:hypothetical protein